MNQGTLVAAGITGKADAESVLWFPSRISCAENLRSVARQPALTINITANSVLAITRKELLSIPLVGILLRGSVGYKPPERRVAAPLPVPSKSTVVAAPVVALNDSNSARTLVSSDAAVRAPTGASKTM